MAWIVSTSIAALRSAFRQRFPNSNTAQDGTIGDAAHQDSASSHNPDDTPGSKAEYTDADSKPEVRALDKDSRLNDPTPMQAVINAILATPADLKRLNYIIFNRQIWRKKNGWKRETYTGSDPHTLHAHFSGDPVFDEDGAPWTSVLKAGGKPVPTGPEQAALNADNALYHALQGHDPITGNKSVTSGTNVTFPNILKAMKDQLDNLVARPVAGNITPTAEQWAVFVAAMTSTMETLFMEKGGMVAEQGAEAALRRVLGSLDGATPPPPQQ